MAGRGDGPERIVVAVDFSEPSIAAAAWVARHFARGAELVLVHVLHVPPVPRFLEGRYPSTGRLVENAREGAEARLRELGTSIATGLVWPEVRLGAPDEEIVRVAEEYGAWLIVVGRPADRAGSRGRIGTTAQRVLRRSTVPVLLAAGLPPGPPARVLAAVDDSDMTTSILHWGARLAERFSAEATAVHVVSVRMFPASSAIAGILTSMEDDAPPAARGEREPVVREAERWLAGQLRDTVPNHSMSPVIASGPVRPEEAILDEAARQRAELIVVGSSGAGRAPRLLFGSVAEAVLRNAECPVFLVVPPAGS